MQKPYKVGIYCRLSVNDASNSVKVRNYIPADESVSIENQYVFLSKFTRLNGWTEIRCYRDDGYSGGNFQRPGFLKMLEDARHGLINLILVKDLSRLGRDFIEVGRYAKLWRYATVKNVLTNESYTGVLIQNRTGTRSYKDSTMICKPESEWMRHDGAHEAIISPEVWTAVQAINQERALFAADSAPPKPFLFTGKLVCADCNAPLKGNREIHLTKNGISKSYVSYCCSCYTSSGSSACTRHTIYEKTLTELVLKEICAHAEKLELNETAVLEMLQRRRSLASDNHVENIRKEITKLRRRVHELEQATAKLYEDKSMGALNSDVFFMMLQKREKERQQKMKRMNNLQAEMDLCAQDNFHIQKWMTLIRKYLHLRELDRAIVDELIDHIEIGERTLVNGQSRRSVKVYYRFVGLVDEAPSLQVNENKLSL